MLSSLQTSNVLICNFLIFRFTVLCKSNTSEFGRNLLFFRGRPFTKINPILRERTFSRAIASFPLKFRRRFVDISRLLIPLFAKVNGCGKFENWFDICNYTLPVASLTRDVKPLALSPMFFSCSFCRGR